MSRSRRLEDASRTAHRFVRRGPRCAWVALLLGTALASCAPHRVAPPALDAQSVPKRYRAELAARAAIAGRVDADASAWVRGDTLGSLPGVHARLAVGAPHAFRVRVESAFGVALDCAAWGESLACFVPSRRMGVALDATADRLGLSAPGALGARLLAATWDPPDAAWARASFEDSLLVVRWEEGGDSLALAVGAGGQPRRVEFRGSGGASVEARYRAWGFVDRTPWPVQVELEDRAARVALTLKLSRVVRNDRPAPGRLTVRVPPDAARLAWPGIRQALERARGS